MKKLLIAFFILGGLLPAFANEQSQQQQAAPSMRDRVAHFLMAKVMGRTQAVATDGTVEQDGEKYLVSFKANVRWSHLKKTPDGVVFYQTRQIQQSSAKIDDAGKVVGPTKRSDRVVIFRYALTERETTNSMVGLANMVRNTLDDPTGMGSVAMIELSPDNKELYLYESQAGFGESSLDGKNIVPTATASEATLFLDKAGKLQMNETLKFYKVDVNKDFTRTEIQRFNLTASEVRN